MTERGYVIDAYDDRVVVEVKRSPMCAKCGACKSIGPSERAQLEIENLCEAQAGDTVLIEMKDGGLFFASLLMYGVPFVALVVGFALGSLAGAGFEPPLSDITTFAVGFALMAVAFFCISRFEPRLKKRKTLPRAVDIVEPCDAAEYLDRAENY